MGQRMARHGNRSGKERQFGETLNERAVIMRLVTQLDDGVLRKALIDVAAGDAQVVARHARLEYDETWRCGKVGGAALVKRLS
jgi:hypothetical protein